MSKKLRILLIEDNKDDAMLLIRELRKAGYEVDYARKQDAVGVNNALEEDRWDLVISDYAMPNFTGRDALDILKSKDIDLPFIIVSGTIGEETAVDAMRAGAHDFLIKRNLKRLGPVIERELREAQNRRESIEDKQELQRWEARFGKAFHASPIPTVIFAIDDGEVINANVRFQQMIDITMPEISGRKVQDLDIWISDEDAADFCETLIKQRQGIRDRETQLQTRTGLSDVLISTEMIDLDGKDCVLAMIYDITERKRSLDRIEKMQIVTAALSGARLPAQVGAVTVGQVANAVKASGAMVMLTDDEGDTLNIVDAFGYPAETIRRWRQTPLNGPDMPLCMTVAEGKALWIGSRDDDAYKPFADFLDANDTQHAAWVALPMTTDQGVIGGICLSYDEAQAFDEETRKYITSMGEYVGQAMERAILYEREQEARRVAEEANELKLKFLAMISHELRTPLMSIKGCTSTLLATDVTWSEEDQGQFISSIDHETDKLTDLVNQLLDGSRMQAGQLRIDPVEMSLMDSVRYAMAQLHNIIQKHLFIPDIPKDLPPVMGDAHRISQVLVNLIENATKYADPHTQITLQAREISLDEGQFIQVEVSDEGIGIKPEEEATIFEFFKQLNRPKGYRSGTGLGLTICKGIVEAHGGRIWVKRRDGPGTTIAFTLPLA